VQSSGAPPELVEVLVAPPAPPLPVLPLLALAPPVPLVLPDALSPLALVDALDPLDASFSLEQPTKRTNPARRRKRCMARPPFASLPSRRLRVVPRLSRRST
jgi:hypothetical protein